MSESSSTPAYQWHGSGPPLVLLAGLGGRGTSWRPFLETVSRRFHTLTFDLPGSGDAPGLVLPTTGSLAEEALGLIDRAGVGRFSLVGRSLGGMVAQELALLAPQRVERLVLTSTTGRCDAHLRELFGLWARMAEGGVDPEIRHRSAMLWCLGAHSLEREGRAYLEAKSANDRPLDYARQARACAGHDALDRLADLAVPALVVCGREDRLTTPPHSEALARTLPNARLSWIADAGHLPYLEQPEAFSAEVMAFLQAPASVLAVTREACA